MKGRVHMIKKSLLEEDLRKTVGGANWKTVSFTDNMECINGVVKVGNCRVKWDVVANQTVNNVTNALIGAGRG